MRTELRARRDSECDPRTAQHRRSRLHRSDRARAGFTLVELLLTIAIISLILGLGLGTLTRIDMGERVSLAEVQNTLRAARNWAVAQDSPACVRIDVAKKTIRAEGLQVIGTWRFENDSLEGAFGVRGAHLGGKTIERGYRGQALSFVGEPPRARVEFPVQTDPACVLRHGFRITCALRGEEDAGGAVYALGDSLGLETSSDGALKGWFAPEIVDTRGGTGRGERVVVDAPAGSLLAQHWSEVALAYDGRALTLEVDRTLVGRTLVDAPVWPAGGPLVLSPDVQPWSGAIDDLVVAVVRAGETIELPSRVAFAKKTPPIIHFEAGGGLDREFHSEPVTLTLDLEDGRTQRATINLFGTVE